jgi:hypothetical protein
VNSRTRPPRLDALAEQLRPMQHPPGMFDIYPEDIEYLTKAYFGGQERPIDTPLDLTQIPIGSIFYGANYDKADQAAVRQRKRLARPQAVHR